MLGDATGPAPAGGQWALDIATQRGRPVIVYRRRGSEGDREYWYARHNGERWLNYKVTSVRHTRDGQVASITLDHETPNTVYLSRNGSRGRLEIEVWNTPDGGKPGPAERSPKTRASTISGR